MKRFFPFLVAGCLAVAPAWADPVLVETESFENHGGWKLDTQFIEVMGSPYLLAHGLGNPVEDAVTTVTFPESGKYRAWVRTKDWVARWDAPGAPGRFEVHLDGKPLQPEQGDASSDFEGTAFGTESDTWHWQPAGEVSVEAGEAELRLVDLTGFGGRCDAIVFSREKGYEPNNTSEVLPAWRREALGEETDPVTEGPFDIVFIGGGYAGSCGAISAARMGLKVALIQNRGVLGGNGSSEIRVWAKGNTPPGLYPVGDIIREFEDDAKASPGTAEEFEDDKKLAIVENEENLSLFLHHHAYKVEMEGETTIRAVHAFDTRSGAIRRFEARNFCDSTGHGTIGKLAGADYTMLEGGRMGMSNMWRWANEESEQTFPEISWALNLEEGDFPYPRKFHAEWFWESGFDKHPVNDLEAIRDWNHRAAFGAWNAIKNKGAYARYDETGKAHANARMIWLAFIGGPRETRQLLGDVILTEEDIVSKRPFPDGCVLTTWSVDLHYPNEQYVTKYPENPFIAKAVHGKGVDRKRGYPIPYRCFYSRNTENLFMAGRNISVTHEALGTVRVMKTCGMMGVVVGKAAAVSTQHEATPREVYYTHLADLIELLELPGNIRRDDLSSDFYEDTNLPKLEEIYDGFFPKESLSGIVIDDEEAEREGDWRHGAGLEGYVDYGYHYAGKGAPAKATFEVKVPEDGEYEVRIAFQPHENRSTKTPVTVVSAGGEETFRVNQTIAPPLAKGFYTLGAHRFDAGKAGAVVFSNDGVDGNAHIDAVQLIRLSDREE